MTTLGQLMKRLEDAGSLQRVDRSLTSRMRWMRIAANHIATVLDRPASRIRLEALVDIDAKLIAFVEGRGTCHQTAVQYVLEKNRLLQLAKHFGWTCRSFALRESWAPIRKALHGNSQGVLKIIKSAIAHGIPASKFGDRNMEVWRQEMRDEHRACQTIKSTEITFRIRLRQAKLERLLPRLDLALRGPAPYAKAMQTMEASLRADIKAKLRWKSRQMVKGRKAKNAISPSAEALGKALRQVCGYAEQERGMKKIDSLREVLTREVLDGMIDWLIEKKNKSSGIKAVFGRIHALLTHHSQYRRSDHSWLRDKMARLPREPRSELDERLNALSIPYTQLEEVPGPHPGRDQRLAAINAR